MGIPPERNSCHHIGAVRPIGGRDLSLLRTVTKVTRSICIATGGYVMKSARRTLPCLFAFFLVAGCASTTVTQQTPMVNQGMPRPNRIWVYSFVADPADMPADSSISNAVSASRTPPTDEQIAQGRQLGALIAADLVADINTMGLTAVQAGPGSSAQVGDGVIRGYLVSVQGGPLSASSSGSATELRRWIR
jgi:hypothetical protein